ncbi:MAG: FAD-dependent oxidoreductase [Deltaproteobacteria bacterium]|nr:FAD-dependent oxidoreductase [Candidatus Anaeroferrophillacea bacterium]
MNPEHHDTDVIIIGGGISGLYAAALLAQENIPFILLEARERLGGRVSSPQVTDGYHTDLGPSWYWPDIQPHMAGLIKALGLTGYRQYERGYGRFQAAHGAVQTVSGFPMEPPSWRLEGGMGALVETLGRRLPAGSVRTGQAVCRVVRDPGGATVDVVETDDAGTMDTSDAWEEKITARITARRVILALPPRLAASTILFAPDLPHKLTQAMLRTGTWMAGQAKFCALYDEPFWRPTGLSGQAFSQYGPLAEIHDGSADDRGPYGFTGFVGVPAAVRGDREQISGAIRTQLGILFGEAATHPDVFQYTDWARERFTATRLDQPPMREHPRYGPPAGQTSFWDETVHFAGTESIEAQGGYLEGALNAGARAAEAMVRS